MVSHVFFDFFGTLVDYDPAVKAAAVNAPLAFCERVGVGATVDEADVLWQRAWDALEPTAVATGAEYSMHDVVEEFRRLIGSPTVSSGDIDRFVDEYLEAWSANVRPLESATTCLADLAVDHELSVVSNTHHPALVPTLMDGFGLDRYVNRIVTSIDVGWRKPHPEIFREALELHGVAASDVAFVGDNWEADVEGPRAVGMTAYYVGRSGAGKQPVMLDRLPELIRQPTRPGAR